MPSRKILLLMALLLVVALLGFSRTWLQGPQMLHYPEFQARLKAGQVAQIQIYTLTDGEWRLHYTDRRDHHAYAVFIPQVLVPESLQQIQAQDLPYQVYSEAYTNDRRFSYLSVFSTLLLFLSLLTLLRRTGLFAPATGKKVTYSPVRFADIGGLDPVVEDISVLTAFLKTPQAFLQMGGKLPNGVLLYGPPGTGKTLIARAIAGEAGVPFLYVSAAEFEEQFVGVGALRVRSLFKKARKQSPCVVFIDELDAVGTHRGRKSSDHTQTLNQLLTLLDGFENMQGVLLLAATNRLETLDAALTRPGRFDRKIFIPMPDQQARSAILERLITRRSIALQPDADLVLLAHLTAGLSGAGLESLLNLALEKAYRSGEPLLSQGHLDTALEELLLGKTRGKVLDRELLENIARHEAGHTLAAYYASLAIRASIYCVAVIPRERALGHLIRLPAEAPVWLSFADLKQELLILLAGRAAEYLNGQQADQVSVGAADDLYKATQLARRMVYEFGYSSRTEQIGLPRCYAERGTDALWGTAGEIWQLPESLQQELEAEVNALIQQAWESALQLLQSQKAALQQVTTWLVQHHRLYLPELEALLSTQRTSPEIP